MRKSILTAVCVVALTPFLMAGTCGGDDTTNQDAFLLFLGLQVIQSNTFMGSCTTATGACTNFVGNSPSGCTGNQSSSVCTTTSAIGSCLQGKNTLVYYSGGIHGTNADCNNDTNCATSCSGGNGTYNADYSG